MTQHGTSDREWDSPCPSGIGLSALAYRRTSMDPPPRQSAEVQMTRSIHMWDGKSYLDDPETVASLWVKMKLHPS